VLRHFPLQDQPYLPLHCNWYPDTGGHMDLRAHALPDNPWLAWTLHIAHTGASCVRGSVGRLMLMAACVRSPGRAR
jgi:hypothetical protein